MVATLFDCGYGDFVSALLPEDASTAAESLFDADALSKDGPALLPHLLTTEKLIEVAVKVAEKYVQASEDAAVYAARSIVCTNAMSVLLKLGDEWFKSLCGFLEKDEDLSALTFCSGAVVKENLDHFTTEININQVPVGCFCGLVGTAYGLKSPPVTTPVDWTQKGVNMEPLYRPSQALVYMHMKICASLENAGKSTELPLGSRVAMYLICAQEGAVKALAGDLDCSKKGLGFEDVEVWTRSYMHTCSRV